MKKYMVLICVFLLYAGLFALGDQGDIGGIGGVPEPASTALVTMAVLGALFKKKR